MLPDDPTKNITCALTAQVLMMSSVVQKTLHSLPFGYLFYWWLGLGEFMGKIGALAEHKEVAGINITSKNID